MNSAEDKLLSVLAIIAVAWMTLGVFGYHARTNTGLKVQNPQLPDAQVNSIAEAIATAEGYYASGLYEGHSLPYKLNNPGSLKKPALGADSLPTWKDTGLIVFPSEEAGWAALQHQIELMLNGDSTVYDPSDTLLLVANKYADGDLAWGRRVASVLGVAPTSTLSEIAEKFPTAPPGKITAQTSRNQNENVNGARPLGLPARAGIARGGVEVPSAAEMNLSRTMPNLAKSSTEPSPAPAACAAGTH